MGLPLLAKRLISIAGSPGGYILLYMPITNDKLCLDAKICIIGQSPTIYLQE